MTCIVPLKSALYLPRAKNQGENGRMCLVLLEITRIRAGQRACAHTSKDDVKIIAAS